MGLVMLNNMENASVPAGRENRSSDNGAEAVFSSQLRDTELAREQIPRMT